MEKMSTYVHIPVDKGAFMLKDENDEIFMLAYEPAGKDDVFTSIIFKNSGERYVGEVAMEGIVSMLETHEHINLIDIDKALYDEVFSEKGREGYWEKNGDEKPDNGNEDVDYVMIGSGDEQD